ncbi:MAG: 4Fe-4S dicluster domain-containing protein [Planctomycetia bacterium]|nr:4Fe-4S dicluster domain-containing protein [Planctomycetia bacterium]
MSTRREFLKEGTLLLAVAGGCGGAVGLWGGKLEGASTCPLPPGSGSWRRLAAHCVSCQLCVATCPEQVIRPTAGAGPVVLDYAAGKCRFDCNTCGEVCPAGAIRPLPLEEKQKTIVGLAAFDPRYCVEVQDRKPCGHCAEVCPTGALVMRVSPTLFYLPTLDTAACIGCGACMMECAKEHAKQEIPTPLSMTVAGVERQESLPGKSPFCEAVQWLRNTETQAVVLRGSEAEPVADLSQVDPQTLQGATVCCKVFDLKEVEICNANGVARIHAETVKEKTLLMIAAVDKTYTHKTEACLVKD